MRGACVFPLADLPDFFCCKFVDVMSHPRSHSAGLNISHSSVDGTQQVSAQHKWSKLNSTLTTLPGRRSDSVTYPPSVILHLTLFRNQFDTFSSQQSLVVSGDAIVKGAWS